MHKPRSTKEYEKGLNEFFDMAFANVCLSGKIVCPCKYCKNGKWINRELAKEHLLIDRFMKGHTNWVIDGEASSSDQVYFQDDILDDMDELVHDAFGVQETYLNMEEESNEQANIFYKLLDDAQKELYPGCKQFSKLAFLI
ncbi:hypothetical protein Sango_1886600 [Sesamum angolense]|uniref:Transposase-associated domain-containing protein n=1 Tax=Sesamum angolense TaxID=2727404 RepID=A0AAE2BQS5_9LAMI|nr:hypothetical protein Sango_1886600 [Sesamum angolense]